MRVPRSVSALLLPLLVVVASIATASPASAGTSDTAPKPVGVGANRLVAVTSWSDHRPSSPTGRPFQVAVWDESPSDCGSNQVTSIWIHRIQAGTGNVLASAYLANWTRCTSDYKSLVPDTKAWNDAANLWSGPGGSPSPNKKQMIRLYLFSNGAQVGAIDMPYPG